MPKVGIILSGSIFGRKIYKFEIRSISKKIRGDIVEGKKQAVLEAMKKAEKPVRPGDIAKMTGIESKEVSKIIKELKKEGLVISPKRCYYSVK